MIYNLLQSIGLLADGSRSFADHMVTGISPNRERIDALVNESLMLVTALNPHIGYDEAARVAKKALADGSSLRDAALALGLLAASQFDEWVVPENMTRPDD
jgi:fumarate hydratase class II